MADTDQNLCPHCGQPMPKEEVVKLGTPAATQGTNTVAEENQRIEASTLISAKDTSEDQQTSLSWEGETATGPNTETHADDTLVKEILDAHGGYKGVEKHIEENTLSTPLSEYEEIEKLNEEDKD